METVSELSSLPLECALACDFPNGCAQKGPMERLRQEISQADLLGADLTDGQYLSGLKLSASCRRFRELVDVSRTLNDNLF